jgi:hypothetical protein
VDYFTSSMLRIRNSGVFGLEIVIVEPLAHFVVQKDTSVLLIGTVASNSVAFKNCGSRSRRLFLFCLNTFRTESKTEVERMTVIIGVSFLQLTVIISAHA